MQARIGSENARKDPRKVNKPFIWRRLKRDKYLYLLLIPVVTYYLIFKYVPLAGEVMAFKDYRFAEGIFGSKWVGLKHFERLISAPDFIRVLRNTLVLNFYQIVFGFPLPILLALMLNEVRIGWYKRTLQSLVYVPHFISWVVLGGIVIALLSPSTGFVNYILTQLFEIEPIYFMASTFWWQVAFIVSGIWQGVGWGTILYLAAMSNIDTQLYEAAKIDGAGKLRQIWHVTLPGIRSLIAILLILRMGSVMEVGFEHIFVLQNGFVLSVADVISTFVYRIGILNLQYSYTTAIGLFQSVIAFILIVTVNKLIKKMGENGLW